MSLDLVDTLRLTSESDIADLEPAVVALVDCRGRRMLVPIERRLPHRRVSRTVVTTMPAFAVDTRFVCGTIH